MSAEVGDNFARQVLAFRLVVAHFLFGLIACVASLATGFELLEAAFVGLMCGQVGLVGVWGGLDTAPWLPRLVGLVTVLLYLGAMFSLGINDQGVELGALVVASGLTMAGLLTICRWFGFRVVAAGVEMPKRTPPQFSIRQLLVLTVVAACMSAAAKWLEPQLNLDLAILSLPIAITFLILTLTAVWAILGTDRLGRGIAVMLLLAPLLGFGLNSLPGTIQYRVEYVSMMTAALVHIVSLCVVRRCGFRVG
jgi:hypothetical protein